MESRPTESNPVPVINLGHDKHAEKNEQSLDRDQRHKKRRRISNSDSKTQATSSTSSDIDTTLGTTTGTTTHSSSTFLLLTKFIVSILFSQVRILKSTNVKLQKENNLLKSQIKSLKLKNRGETTQKWTGLLISNSQTQFFTGLESRGLFTDLHDYVAPYVKRRWKGFKALSTKVRRFVHSPKKFGPQRKLSSPDEFLLTLMWLRLGLLKQDLAVRFGISTSLCSQIFNTWLTAMSKVLRPLLDWPTKEQIIATKPMRFKHLPDLRTIIDCSEIFIDVPKDPRLQTSTWSNYKHHNTAKFLIGVAPNSAITFLSHVYNGRASDKAITLDSGFLDKLDPYDMIQADKGFHIGEECAARCIHLHVPPGKRGKAQMSRAANNKTSRIANLRILVEQIIRRVKTFRLIRYGIPISLVPALDKILTVCSALCNLKKPIYTN